jgi:hypothetical protein
MKKGISIILIVGLLLLCCCVVVLGGGFFIANQAVAGTEPAQEMAYQLCEQKGDLTLSSYNEIFNQDFKDITTLEETQEFLDQAFPSTFNCADLKGNNIVTLLTKGYSISTESDMDQTIATYIAKVGDYEMSFYYRFENNQWYIEGLYIE